MATTTINKLDQSDQSQTDALFIAAALAHVPVGIEYSMRMWRTGHYQFFPLLLCVVLWMIFDRVSKLSNKKRSVTTYVLVGINLLLLGMSVLLYSSFLWSLSFLLLTASFVYDRWGWSGILKGSPAWLLLFFIVPLPMNLDVKLITKMQFVASQLASWILDAFGQTHFREGVILITEKKQFFTEEACSGIRSLFSSMAAIAIYGVMRDYSILRHVFNLVQTTVWVIVGNAIRVAIVVYVSDNWTEAIASGTTHEMLGLAIFLFIFALALSTDRAIDAVMQQGLDDGFDRPKADNAEEPVTNSNNNLLNAKDPKPMIRWILVGCFGLLCLFAVRLTYAKISLEVLQYDFYAQDDLMMLDESEMPAEINGWRLEKFEHQLRDDAQLLAAESFLWTYRKGTRKATVSLDSPYYEYHNLTNCYNGFGWNVECKHDYASPSGEETTANMSVLKMRKQQETGLVLFTAMDRTGKLVVPDVANFALSRPSAAMDNLKLALGMVEQSSNSNVLPISQIQLIYTADGELVGEDEAKELFLVGRKILRNSKRFAQ